MCLQGLGLLSVSSRLYLIWPGGCGVDHLPCGPHSGKELGIFFYIALYMIAFGNGGYQPNIATFGADQFDEEDPAEAHSKVSFFSYFYLALNLGSLFSNTFLSYIEDKGGWALGFWASTAAAVTALLLFLCGTLRYRYVQPGGNPISRVAQVAVAACRNWKTGDDESTGVVRLYEEENSGGRKLMHTHGFRSVYTCFISRCCIVLLRWSCTHLPTDPTYNCRDAVSWTARRTWTTWTPAGSASVTPGSCAR
jgi:solute carrier family 15 (peptide/histidine transporter), member 3/4